MLSNSPGSIGFEMAPFKLPQDYIDILGGFDSPKFAEFRALFKQCFRDARKHAERIITLVELMQKGESWRPDRGPFPLARLCAQEWGA
jgi:phosphatidylinositol kinase/protein kinase (PI-3  family)